MNSEEAVLAVIAGLEAACLPYMIVGSLSSNYYGIPRSTRDADLVVQFETQPFAVLTAGLAPGLHLDPQMSFEMVTGTFRHLIHLINSPFTIELFHLSDDPHDQERFRRRQSVRLFDRKVFVPTPEDVIITKLRWCVQAQRNKDRDDVRDVITVQQGVLDWDYVHGWCERHGTRQLLDEIRLSIPSV
jgi:hypothetical protein